MISHETILAVLESRYDHVSARVILGDALKAAGLTANAKGYDADQVRALSNALASIGSRVEGVTARLNQLAGEIARAPAVETQVAEPTAGAPETPAQEAATASTEAAPAESAREPAAESTEAAPAEPDAEAAPKKKKKK